MLGDSAVVGSHSPWWRSVATRLPMRDPLWSDKAVSAFTLVAVDGYWFMACVRLDGHFWSVTHWDFNWRSSIVQEFECIVAWRWMDSWSGFRLIVLDTFRFFLALLCKGLGNPGVLRGQWWHLQQTVHIDQVQPFVGKREWDFGAMLRKDQLASTCVDHGPQSTKQSDRNQKRCGSWHNRNLQLQTTHGNYHRMLRLQRSLIPKTKHNIASAPFDLISHAWMNMLQQAEDMVATHDGFGGTCITYSPCVMRCEKYLGLTYVH